MSTPSPLPGTNQTATKAAAAAATGGLITAIVAFIGVVVSDEGALLNRDVWQAVLTALVAGILGGGAAGGAAYVVPNKPKGPDPNGTYPPVVPPPGL